MGKVNHEYVSEIDAKLAEFNQSHPKSESQMDEILKHERIFSLRDTPQTEDEPESIWDF